MADRYWVGGTANWDATAGAKWALTSGGAGGQAVPTSNDDVYFDGASGAGTVTVLTTRPCQNLNFTGFTGTLAGSAIIEPYGSLTLDTAVTWTFTGDIYLSATTTGQTFDPKGITLNSALVLGARGTGGEWKLLSNLVLSKNILLINGTFDADIYNVTLTLVSLSAGTKTLKLGSGTWTVTAAGNAWNANASSTGLTVDPGTATIKMTSASAKTFFGGGFSWPTLDQGGAGALTIQQNNTFANITNSYGATGATSILFTASTTQTVTQFTASGTAGKLLTLDSTVAGTRFTLSDTSGTNSVSYCSIKNSIATGGATWQALTADGNVDAGNNLGWIFSAIPFTYSQTSGVKLRSLAQRGRF
jgi:hypothetical protein